MPRTSDFVPFITSTSSINDEQVVVEPLAPIGLIGGNLQDTVIELQNEINENSEAAASVLVLFENSLL